MNRINFIKKLGGYYGIPLMVVMIIWTIASIYWGIAAFLIWATFFYIDFNNLTKQTKLKGEENGTKNKGYELHTLNSIQTKGSKLGETNDKL